MAVIKLSETADAYVRVFSFNTSISKNGAGDSDILIIPPGSGMPLSVRLVLVSAGTAAVYDTLTPRNTVETGGTVNWEKWSPGDCTATTDAMCGPVSALKITVTSGNWTLEVRSV